MLPRWPGLHRGRVSPFFEGKADMARGSIIHLHFYLPYLSPTIRPLQQSDPQQE